MVYILNLIATLYKDISRHHLSTMSVARFSIAIPTNSLEKSHQFYTQVVGCQEIERGSQHVRYSFFSHELVLCYIDDSFVPQEHCNHVDQHDVPVPHFGIVLSEHQFH